MSSEQLLAGYRYANKRFYACKNIFRRVLHSRVGLPWALPLNCAYALANW